VHAIIQEYGLDKLNRKFHLSKVKHAKFNESGQLCVFFLTSIFWAGHLIYTEKLITSLTSLWEGYPHIALPFWGKVFFIIQISYWIHNYPELYFQKIKKEDMAPIIVYSSMYLFTLLAAYFLNFSRLALVLLLAHYTVEALFHVSRLLYFSGNESISRITFFVWNALYVLTRIGSATLAYLVFIRGLEKSSVDHINPLEGNFNTQLVRLNCFGWVILVQVYMMWNFIIFHMRRYRDKKASKKASATFVTNADLIASKGKNKAKRADGDVSDGHEDSRSKKKN
jgi:translocating chain-associated membrane protein 1